MKILIPTYVGDIHARAVGVALGRKAYEPVLWFGSDLPTRRPSNRPLQHLEALPAGRRALHETRPAPPRCARPVPRSPAATTSRRKGGVMHRNSKRERRTLERRLAEELSKEELEKAMGGVGLDPVFISTDSASGGVADD